MNTQKPGTQYFYKGVKVSIWGRNKGQCTIVVEDKETADRLGGFERHDESYLTWFYKTVDESEVEEIS